jgi:hypothetical protein
MSRRARGLMAVALAAGACVCVCARSEDGAASAPAARRHAGAPAANFLVEWRVQPVDAPAPRGGGGWTITSRSATVGGASGFGPGAVVVGTARAPTPQAVRVSNGKEGAIRFDDSETHLVYDMSFAASSSAQSAAAASGATDISGSVSQSQSQANGVAGHDVVIHRVDGLRVTPHWTRGDTLELDVALTHAAPRGATGNSSADSRYSRGIDFHSTVRLSFDEWQGVATVGDGGEELQIRVSWR